MPVSGSNARRSASLSAMSAATPVTPGSTVPALANDRALRRLCGWESIRALPSEATFSRAFAEFAEGALPSRLHEALITDTMQEQLVGHVSRDATAIEGREKATPKPQQPAKPKPKRKRTPATRRARPARAPGRCPPRRCSPRRSVAVTNLLSHRSTASHRCQSAQQQLPHSSRNYTRSRRRKRSALWANRKETLH